MLWLWSFESGIMFTYLFDLTNRSAKEAEDNIRKALEKGQVLPKEERFDSNCITPGMGILVYCA